MISETDKSLVTIAKGAGIVFFGMILGNLLGMIYQILLGRLLGPEDYGLFNLAGGIIALLSTFSVFGLYGSLSRFVPYHLKRNEKEIVKSGINFSFTFVLSTSFVMAVVLFVFSGRISTDIFNEERLQPVLQIFALFLPILAVEKIIQGLLRGFKAVKYHTLIYQFAIKMVKIPLFIILIFLGYQLFGAVFSLFTGLVFGIVLSWIIIKKKIFPDYSSYKRVPIAKKLLLFSWPLALTGMVYILMSKTDSLLLGYFLDSSSVGIYTTALVIAGLLNAIGSSFAYIFLPVISEFFAKNDVTSLESLFKSTSKWVFLIVFPLLLYILLFPQEIIDLLYGSAYIDGYMALAILSIGISMNLLTGVTGNILVGSGHTKMNLSCEIFALLFNVPLNIILIPLFGILGAAIATSFSLFARNIFSIGLVYKTTRMHPFKRNYFSIILSGFSAILAIYLVKINFSFIISFNYFILVLGPIFLAIYIILVLLSKGLDENDLVILEAIEKKTGINLNFIKKFI